MKEQLTRQELDEAIAHVLNSDLMDKYEENGEVYWKVNREVAENPNFDTLTNSYKNK